MMIFVLNYFRSITLALRRLFNLYMNSSLGGLRVQGFVFNNVILKNIKKRQGDYEY